jgi:hypothetical protein
MSNQSSNPKKIHINYMDFGPKPGITGFRLGKYLEEFNIEYLDTYRYYSETSEPETFVERKNISTITIRDGDVSVILDNGQHIVICFNVLGTQYKVKDNILIGYIWPSKEQYDSSLNYPI